MTLLMFSILLMLAYMRRKSIKIGAAMAFAIAYMLSIKVDMIVGVAVLALVLLLGRDRFEGPDAKKQLITLFEIIVVTAIVAAPALLYIYIASSHSFGVAAGQPKFSISYLDNDSVQNALMWFGAYDKVSVPMYNSTYYDEFPLTFTLFAILGAAALIRKGRIREFVLLGMWFAVIFLFYSSYYSGAVLGAAGVDVRYFLGVFPVISILAAYGFFALFDLIASKINKKRKRSKSGLQKRALLAIMLVILFAEASWLFATIVTISPYHIYPFAAERYDERFVTQNYQQIPSNCIVLTFKPILWYVLGRGNIYAGWINSSNYYQEVENMSDGCLYFDYSISCYINWTSPPNTAQQCRDVVREFSMQPIASMHLDNYSWNVSMYLYKITGLNTSSSSK